MPLQEVDNSAEMYEFGAGMDASMMSQGGVLLSYVKSNLIDFRNFAGNITHRYAPEMDNCGGHKVWGERRTIQRVVAVMLITSLSMV